MALTDTAIRNTKSTDKPFKIFDGGGLHLLVNPSGSRLWRQKYRYRGREKLLSFGPYPLISLKQARMKRDEAKRLLLEDKDPVEEGRLEKLRKDRERAVTFGVVADEYLGKLRAEGRAPATMKKLEWLVGHTHSNLFDRPIRQIEAPDILKLLRKVEACGTYETSRRLRSTIGTIFRYAIATGRAQFDPSDALKGALIQPKVKPRAAILDRRDFGELLHRIDGMSGSPSIGIALNLLALLAPRPGELRLAHWSEFDFEEAVWRVPADRMKMRRDHRVPLPVPAIALLRELHTHNGQGELLFPSVRSQAKPMSENTLNAALKRLGYRSDQITAHGFRATFTTLANESGLWNADAIERALSHVESNDVRKAYLRGEFWEERVRLADWWAKELEQMRQSTASAEKS